MDDWKERLKGCIDLRIPAKERIRVGNLWICRDYLEPLKEDSWDEFIRKCIEKMLEDMK